MKKPLEKEIQKKILKALWDLNIFSWRNNSGAIPAQYKGKNRLIQFGAPGSPDILAVTSGYFVGIECKRPGGQQTESQKAFQQNIEGAGGCYILASSVKDLKDGLIRLKQNK